MKRSKKRPKGKRKEKPSLFRKRRLPLLLAFIVLSTGVIGGTFIAKSVSEKKERRSPAADMVQGASPEKSSGGMEPAIYDASRSNRELFEQLNCVCGNCHKVLADCTCILAKTMKDQVLAASRKYKTQQQVLKSMVALYGQKVVSEKSGPAKSQQPSGTPGPKIHVEPPLYDLGTIPQEVVAHMFTVKNKGKSDLVISDISTSCGCTTAEIDENIIPPGKEATLTVTFDPLAHDTQGKTTRTVYLKTNDPKDPVKEIKIRAFVQSEKKAAKELPSFAYNSAQTLEGYRIATQFPHVLENIPCYCGCGIQSKHRHLKDCFIKPDGAYDEHGSGCNLCDREAIDVKKWLDENIPIKEIRARIEEKYKKFGSPTQTPPI